MRQYKLCIQIIIIIVIKKKNKIKRNETDGRIEERGERMIGFLFFFLFISFSDLRKSDHRFLSE